MKSFMELGNPDPVAIIRRCACGEEWRATPASSPAVRECHGCQGECCYSCGKVLADGKLYCAACAQPCEDCGGTGRDPGGLDPTGEPCQVCHGSGVEPQEDEMERARRTA